MVARSGSEVTKHSTSLLPPKSDKPFKPKKLSTGLSKGPVKAGSILDKSFTKDLNEIKIKSKKPKTIANGNGFIKIGARPKPSIPLATDQDALRRPIEHYGEQCIKKRLVETGSIQDKSLKKSKGNMKIKSPNLKSKGFGYGFEKLSEATCNLGTDGARSNFFDLKPYVTHGTEQDVLCGHMASVGEQHVHQRAVEAGSIQNKSFKKSKDKMRRKSTNLDKKSPGYSFEKLIEASLDSGVAGARSKNLSVKPNNVPLATDQYSDQGKLKEQKKGKKKTGHRSFPPSISEQESYKAFKATAKALKEETRRLRIKMQDEAEITMQIKDENTFLMDELRQKCPPNIVAKFEAENPSR